jgi:hypothetical protein
VFSTSTDGIHWERPRPIPLRGFESFDAISSGVGRRRDDAGRHDAPRRDVLEPAAGQMQAEDLPRRHTCCCIPRCREHVDGAMNRRAAPAACGVPVATSFVPGHVAVAVYADASKPFDDRFHQGIFAARVGP